MGAGGLATNTKIVALATKAGVDLEGHAGLGTSQVQGGHKLRMNITGAATALAAEFFGLEILDF